MEKAKEIVKKAVVHKGYALVDIFQTCVTYNKINTFKWFKNNTYYVDESYNPFDRTEAFAKAIETDKLALGIIYINDKPTFEDNLSVYQKSKEPLYSRYVDLDRLRDVINRKSGM